MDQQIVDEKLIKAWYDGSNTTINTLAIYYYTSTNTYTHHFGDCSSILSTTKDYQLLIPTEWWGKTDISPLLKMVAKMIRECFVYVTYQGVKKNTELLGFLPEHRSSHPYLSSNNEYYVFYVNRNNFKHNKHQMMAHTMLRYLWSPKFARIMYHALMAKIKNPEMLSIDCFVTAHNWMDETETAYEGYKGMMAYFSQYKPMAPLSLGQIAAQINDSKRLFNHETSSELYTTALFVKAKQSIRDKELEIYRNFKNKLDYKGLCNFIKGLKDCTSTTNIA